MSLQQTALQQTWLSTNLSGNRSHTNTIVNSDTRRMSEPCHTLTDRKSPPPRPASVTLSPLKTTDLHPNQAVVLDEVGEGEMVENKLVIPDEMVHYLNQVADTHNGDFNGMQWPEARNTDQKPLPSPNQMITSPAAQMLPSPNPTLSQMLPSPSSNFSHILPSPQNTNVMSPSTAVNQMVPSPGGMNQMIPSPAANINQMMSPASNINQMIPSPATNLNQMIPSPAANMAQMMPSPAPNYTQIMHSPASNFGGIQNPMMSPAPSMNQMVPSPSSNMNQMVQSPMSVRCHSQMMSPNINQQNAMMQSPSHPLQSPNQMMPNQQNCNMVPQQQMMQNGQMMVQNQCYNNPVNHNVCYMQHNGGNWDHNNMQMQGNDHHNMCHSRNVTMDYNQCRNRMQTNGYANSTMSSGSGNQCGNHSYQMCNNNGYLQNNCYQNKHINGYVCNTNPYPPMQNPGYGCVPNMNEPLQSPAIATPAPNDTINQPQQAQMSRPCTQAQISRPCNNHYGQNCYRCNNQCMANTGANPQQCGCQKTNMYAQSPNKCYHRCTNGNEIQCKDISQSQVSPGIVNQAQQNLPAKNNTANGNTVQPLGMRQDAYQRTLEYVQNCQSWVENSETVSSTTNPVVKCGDAASSNMIVNDMTSSLSSLLEENRYLQMIQ